ncbi:AzlC family ABC transporter permease [Salinirubellus salinus]|uniref:AzlC family ABC transporter permease n=1 Tax=Salinirubellus salinus TaxID=1364945 RepID=A0A9E7R399_9EURY|nr:AzlC family ABC transporter permease [Salinirubellus salinus]UWM54658.1 AzlC family ABC transporter permease [Salinirubellus salinus]
MSRREALRAGVRATTPVVLGVVPFGLVAGAAAIGAGLSILQAAALSVVVFAGASQLAIIELLGRDAALVVVVGTALVINARMFMYSASLAPHFLEEDSRWRARWRTC